MAHRVSVSGGGGGGAGWTVMAPGGAVSSSCPFAFLLHTPLQSRASDPQRHQWSLGGGRRQEAGTRGWSGGRRKRGRVSWRQAG